MRAAFVQAQAGAYPVRSLCRVLRLSRSGYYARQHRPESCHAREDRRLLVYLQATHREAREAYGAVKLWRALQQRGVACGKHRVARLRRQAGLATRRVRRFRLTTAARQHCSASSSMGPRRGWAWLKIRTPRKGSFRRIAR